MTNKQDNDKKKLLLIISDPAKSWGEITLLEYLEYDDKHKTYKKLYIYIDKTTSKKYDGIFNGYCFALLAQDKWKECQVLKKLVQEVFDVENIPEENAIGDNIYIYIHKTDGPDNDSVKKEMNKFNVIINPKHIKRFSHEDNDEYQPVKKILKAAEALKKASDLNNVEKKKAFADVFAATIEPFIVYSAPYHLLAIQFLLQALCLKKIYDNGMDALKKTLKSLLDEDDKIKKELDGLDRINSMHGAGDLSADLLCKLKDELGNEQKVKDALDILSNYLKSLAKPFFEQVDTQNKSAQP